jgi:uncharacterized membrane protein YphA (DoxX/SURF4 family)
MEPDPGPAHRDPVTGWLRLLFSGPVTVLLVTLIGLGMYRVLDRVTRPPFYIFAIRCFLGSIFVFSGLAKLIPDFPNSIGPPWLEARLEPYGLALFARFIAVTELAVGLLLLSRRFATLGALMLFPMITGILVTTISLEWRGTPYVNTVFLLLNATLLAYDYPRLRWIIAESPPPDPGRPVLRGDIGPLVPWLGALSVFLLVLAFTRPATAWGLTGILSSLAALALVVTDWRRG